MNALAQNADQTPRHLNRRTSQISMSATIAMSEKAASLRRSGHDIVSLSLGELDFATPDRVVRAAAAAAQAGETRYTAADGTPAVKKAVQAKLLRDNGLNYPLNQIHVASGCKQVIYNAFAATIEPGDEVILFAPYWVSYADMVEFCGGKPVIVPTSPDSGFMPDPRALKAVLGPRTRWVLLNSPNNPTGAVYDPGLLASLAKIVAEWPDVQILSDEIYEHLIYEGEHRSPATLCPELQSRILVVNGVSKAYAMTGWRIGFAAGPEWLISGMAKVQSQTAGSSNSIAQAATAEALTGDQSLISEWRGALQRRRDLMIGILEESPRLRVIKGAGAFYVYADVSRCIGARTPQGQTIADDNGLANYLLESAGVATVAGDAFGMSPYLRLSFALDEAQIGKACRRIVSALANLVPAEETK